MKKSRNILLILVALIMVLTTAGCGSKNIEGTLPEIMDKLYANIPEDERPMMLTNMEIDAENIEGFLGTADIEYEEALASESATGSIAHSVVLVRVKDGANIEAIKEKIEKSVNPRKWICVEAEDVEVESKGNLIVLIMSSETNTEKIETAFDNLK